MSQAGVCCARSHGAEISGSSNPVANILENLYDCVNNDDPSIYLKDVGQEDSMTLLRCQFYVTFVASVFKVIKSPTNNSIL